MPVPIVYRLDQPPKLLYAVQIPTLDHGKGPTVREFDPQFGRYTLHTRLNCGGMAEIWRATLRGVRGFAKTVALKRILPEWQASKDFQKMFIEEAQMASAFGHPNVISVSDFGEHLGSLFLTMEWLQGLDCSQIIQKCNESSVQLDPAEVAALGEGICAGLHYVHTDPSHPTIVHRDVSPHNVMVDRYGAIKVMDFGIAKLLEQTGNTQAGIVRGKAGYLPPERAAGAPATAAGDQYGVGLILWECFAGHPMRQGDGDLDRLRQATEGALRPWPKSCDVPDELKAIIEKSLAKDPEQRFASAALMQEALADFRLRSGRLALADWGKRIRSLQPQEAAMPPAAAPKIRPKYTAVATPTATISQPYPYPNIAKETPQKTRPLRRKLRPWNIAALGTCALVIGLGSARACIDGRAQAPDPIQKMGYFSLRTRDAWLEVHHQGKLLGNTPLQAISLPAGKQTLELRDPKTQRTTILEVTIQADAHTRKTWDKGEMEAASEKTAHPYVPLESEEEKHWAK